MKKLFGVLLLLPCLVHAETSRDWRYRICASITDETRADAIDTSEFGDKDELDVFWVTTLDKADNLLPEGWQTSKEDIDIRDGTVRMAYDVLVRTSFLIGETRKSIAELKDKEEAVSRKQGRPIKNALGMQQKELAKYEELLKKYLANMNQLCAKNNVKTHGQAEGDFKTLCKDIKVFFDDKQFGFAKNVSEQVEYLIKNREHFESTTVTIEVKPPAEGTEGGPGGVTIAPTPKTALGRDQMIQDCMERKYFGKGDGGVPVKPTTSDTPASKPAEQ